MSSVCIFCGWACAAYIVGLQATSKTKNKVRPAVDNGSWDRLKEKKNVLNPAERPWINWTKTYGFWVLVLSPLAKCTPWDRLRFFFVLNPGARFVHCTEAQIPFSLQHWTYHQYWMFTATTHEQDLKLEICHNNLVKTYDHSAAYCVLRGCGA